MMAASGVFLEISVPARRGPPNIIAHHPILVERASCPQRPRDCNYGGKAAEHASEAHQHDVEIIARNLRRPTPPSRVSPDGRCRSSWNQQLARGRGWVIGLLYGPASRWSNCWRNSAKSSSSFSSTRRRGTRVRLVGQGRRNEEKYTPRPKVGVPYPQYAPNISD